MVSLKGELQHLQLPVTVGVAVERVKAMAENYGYEWL